MQPQESGEGGIRQRGDEGARIRARSDLSAEHALAFENTHGFADAGAAHSQARGEVALRGKRVADLQRPRHDLVLDRLDDELVRAAALHGCPFRGALICHRGILSPSSRTHPAG